MSRMHVETIRIRHFKAFHEFQIDLEGRHLLVYGANGSGKSSLYWALYTFLESSIKQAKEVQKYFDPDHEQSLINIHVGSPENESALIELCLSVGDQREYKISFRDHDTKDEPLIARARLASDFINYRFIFRFSDFRNSQTFDFWGLFEQEILPFCRTTSGDNLYSEWVTLVDEQPHHRPLVGGAITRARNEFDQKLVDFHAKVSGVVADIGQKASEFYDEHFADDDQSVEFRIGIAKPPVYDRSAKRLVPPILKLEVKKNGREVHKPHVLLNEAKLTQIAVSIRFAASLVNLHESDLKLLVLDDLLVSLDMSNRMKVVEILLSDTFANYQKIILTHDLGFFREFRRTIGDSHEEWCFMSLSGDASKGISVRNEKSAIEKAEDYLNHYDLEEAAVWMRKAAEDSAKRFRAMAEGKQPPPGEFHSLTKNLRAARNKLREKLPVKLYEEVLKGVPEEHRGKLVRMNNDDIDADSSLDEKMKRTIKKQRAKLAKFLNEKGWRHLEAIETLDAILKMTDRVLNPAAHWGEPALYEAELKKALRLIRKFENSILPNSG